MLSKVVSDFNQSATCHSYTISIFGIISLKTYRIIHIAYNQLLATIHKDMELEIKTILTSNRFQIIPERIPTCEETQRTRCFSLVVTSSKQFWVLFIPSSLIFPHTRMDSPNPSLAVMWKLTLHIHRKSKNPTGNNHLRSSCRFFANWST